MFLKSETQVFFTLAIFGTMFLTTFASVVIFKSHIFGTYEVPNLVGSSLIILYAFLSRDLIKIENRKREQKPQHKEDGKRPPHEAK